MFFFFLLFLTSNIRGIRLQCLQNSKPSSISELCEFCSFDHYDSRRLKNFSNPPLPNLNDCLPKIQSEQERMVLILNNNETFPNISLTFQNKFDEIYSNIVDAFQTESYLNSLYNYTKIIFLLSKGSHYILENLSLYGNKILFFKRWNANITIKPLFCNEYNIETFCCEPFINRPTIFLKSFNFSVIVSGKVLIENIDFNGIDNNYNLNDSLCPNEGSLCCEAKNLIDNKSYCYIAQNIDNSYKFQTENNLNGLFQLEVIFDNPNFSTPELIMNNISFQYFYVFSSRKTNFLSLIVIDYPGGNLLINNLEIIDSFFENPLITYNNTYSLKKMYYSHFFDYFKEKIMDFHFSIGNIIIKNYNLFGFEKHLIFQKENAVVLLTKNFNLIFLSKINGNAISGVENKYLFYMKYCSNIFIFDSSFAYIEKTLFFYFENSSLILKNFTISNSSLNDSAFFFSKSSNLYISQFYVESSYINQSNSVFLVGDEITFYLIYSAFNDLFGFSVYFRNSFIIFMGCEFRKIIMNGDLTFWNSNFLSIQNKWTQIYGFQNMLAFFECQETKIISNNYTNIQGSSFIGGNTLLNVLLSNISFSDISDLIYIFNKATIFSNIIIYKSIFSDINLNLAFLHCKDDVNILISSSNFLNIGVIKKTLYFILARFGQHLIQNSTFVNVTFFQGGNAIVIFQNSDVIIKNNDFLDCGFNYPINPSEFLSLDYGGLFYLWTNQQILIENNSLINNGKINQFSGFFHCTLTVGKIIFQRNFLKIAHKVSNTFYNGVIISNPPILIFKNNKFHNLECPDYPSFIHSNAPVTLQGDNSYQFLRNKKKVNIIENLFYNCKCSKGGSLGVINFEFINMDKIYSYNSSAKSGGSFIFISSSTASLSNIYVNYSESIEANIMIGQSITNLLINNMTISNTYSEISGGVKIKGVQFFLAENFQVFNSLSVDSGGVFNIKSGSTFIINSYFISCYSLMNGGVIYIMEKGDLILSNSSFHDSRAKMGGAIYIDFGILLVLKNITFTKTFSVFLGGAIFINLIDYVIAENILFKYCVTLSNGILYMKNFETEAIYLFTNFSCENNKAIKGNCLFNEAIGNFELKQFKIANCINNSLHFSSSTYIKINMSEGILTNISTEIDILYLNQAQVNLCNISFHNNSVFSSVLTIENLVNSNLYRIIFKMNSKNNDNFVPVIESSFSFVYVKEIYFEQSFLIKNATYLLSSVESGLIFDFCNISFQNHNSKSLILIQNSYFMLNNSIFQFNKSPILYMIDSNISLEFSRFLNNKGQEVSNVGDIFILSEFSNNILVNMSNSEFKLLKGIVMSISKIQSLFYRNCTFEGNYQSTALNLIDISFISVDTTTFKNFQQNESSGGAIYFSFTNIFGVIKMFNCSFISNAACFGGALYLEGIYNITIYNSFFFNNSAISNISKKKCGLFGVGLLHCNIPFICYNLLRDNLFLNNSADILAPTIYTNTYTQEENDIFLKNTEKEKDTLRDKVISFPLNISLQNKQNITYITSGEEISLVFILMDSFQNNFTTRNNITATIIKISNDSDLVLKNSISLPTNKGVFNFTNLLINKKPATNFTLRFRVSLFDEITNKFELIEKDFYFFSRACKIGEIITLDFKCDLCKTNYFSLKDPMQNQNIHYCLKCVTNAFCPGGSYLIPIENYWRFSSNSKKINKCIYKGLCLGPPNIPLNEYFDKYDLYFNKSEFIHGVCREGNQGNLCSMCSLGYGRANNDGICSLCSDIFVLVYIKIAFLFVLIVAYILLNVKTIIKSSDSSNVLTILFKISINHIQKISIVKLFSNQDLKFGIENFFYVLESGSLLNENTFSNDCLFLKIFENFDDFYLYKIFFSLILPIIASFLSLLVLVILENCVHITSRTLLSGLQKTHLIFLISCFIFYPYVTKCSLSMINCISLDETDEKYLYSSPNLQCWSGIHENFFIVISIVGIFIWGIVFPLILSFVIRKSISKRNIKYIFSTKKISSSKGMLKSTHRENAELYIFFYKDYKSQYYYWESMIFFQKFTLSLCLNLTQIIGYNIDALFLILMVVYIFLLIKLKPFKIEPFNKLEILSSISIVLSRLFLLLNEIYAEENESLLSMLFSIAFLTINIVFFCVSIFYAYKLKNWKKMFSQYKEKITGIKKRINLH